MKIYTFDIAKNNRIPFFFFKNDRSEKTALLFFFSIFLLQFQNFLTTQLSGVERSLARLVNLSFLSF